MEYKKSCFQMQSWLTIIFLLIYLQWKGNVRFFTFLVGTALKFYFYF